jgi:hypothetical protein
MLLYFDLPASKITPRFTVRGKMRILGDKGPKPELLSRPYVEIKLLMTQRKAGFW